MTGIFRYYINEPVPCRIEMEDLVTVNIGILQSATSIDSLKDEFNSMCRVFSGLRYEVLTKHPNIIIDESCVVKVQSYSVNEEYRDLCPIPEVQIKDLDYELRKIAYNLHIELGLLDPPHVASEPEVIQSEQERDQFDGVNL